jgi:3-oxoacyl-[acyl-carrier-protein] synthase-1
MREALAIVRVGLCCPVGLDTAEVAASLRAGVSRKLETGFIDRNLEPIIVGHVEDADLPGLAPRLHDMRSSTLQRRLLRLATLPLREVLADHPAKSPPALHLAGPPAAGQTELVDGQFFAQLVAQAGQEVDVGASRLFSTGRAGFFAAVAAARDELFEARSEFVLVGGVDSYLDPARLAALDHERRLRTSGPQDAFTPGEAAAFMLLARRATCQRHQLQPLAWLLAVAVANEPGHHYSEQPFLGDGLTEAFRATFEQVRSPLEPIRLMLAGLNGERLLAKEGGIALLRHRDRFHDELRIEHAAEYIGDAGAALAPLMLGATAHGMRAGISDGPALAWGSSDHGQRGALILCADTRGGHDGTKDLR